MNSRARTILIVILSLLLVASLPWYGFNAGWGYFSAVILAVALVAVLRLTGRRHF